MRRIPSQQHDGGLHRRLAARCAGAVRLRRASAGVRPGLLGDRRGATALMFAVSLLTVIGFVGLATEVGTWYVVRREAQGVADAAAIAGALAANDAIAANTDPASAAQSVVAALATANGFTDGASTPFGSVTVTPTYYSNYAPASPSTYVCTPIAPSITCPAEQVAVSETVAPLISRLFGGNGITVGAQSVAWLQSLGGACALSLTGDLTVSGTLRAPGCGLASDNNDSTAINVTGSLTALTITAVGNYAGSPTLTRPAAPYHPPTANPYSSADSATLPTFGTCTTPTVNNGVINPLLPYERNGNVAYCGLTIDGINVTSVYLQAPGTFFFTGPVMMTGGTLWCTFCNNSTGISIVMLGSTATLNIGSIAFGTNINAGTNASFPALSGILLYGRGTSPVGISLQGATTSPMDGGVYFPNATLTFTGSATSPSSCLSLVAASITLYSTFSLAVTGCSGYGTAVAQMKGARVVQ